MGPPTSLALEFPVANMRKSTRGDVAALKIKISANKPAIPCIGGSWRPRRRGCGRRCTTCLLTFGHRHEGDLMQVVRVIAPGEAVSGLKLMIFVIKLQDTHPFLFSGKLHDLDGVSKVITNIASSRELAGKQKAVKNASIGNHPLRERDTLEPRPLLSI